jgi:hypothetical protein
MVFISEEVKQVEHNSEDKSNKSTELPSFMFIPTDLNNIVFFGFLTIGFVAWFPCHSIFVALPFFTESTEKYESSLIAFPVCIFLPTLLSDYSVLLSWPKIRMDFTHKVKCALSC